MKQSNDGCFSFLKILVFEQFCKDIEGHHNFNDLLNGLISALGHICNKVEVFNEIEPGCIVLLFAYFVVIGKSTFFGNVLVNSGLGINDIIFF